MQKGAMKGAAIAGALAAMLTAGVAHAADKMDKQGSSSVKCMGANDCKGHGNCKSAKNDCKGQNSCKGTSWTMESNAKACTDKHGTVASK